MTKNVAKLVFAAARLVVGWNWNMRWIFVIVDRNNKLGWFIQQKYIKNDVVSTWCGLIKHHIWHYLALTTYNGITILFSTHSDTKCDTMNIWYSIRAISVHCRFQNLLMRIKLSPRLAKKLSAWLTWTVQLFIWFWKTAGFISSGMRRLNKVRLLYSVQQVGSLYDTQY